MPKFSFKMASPRTLFAPVDPQPVLLSAISIPPRNPNSTSRLAPAPSLSPHITRSSKSDRQLYEFRNVDKDPRYQRIDHSEIHAADARLQFLLQISQGENFIDLAEAAFMIAAEDDALATNSSVKLPVDHIKARLERLAKDVERSVLSETSRGDGGEEEILRAMHEYLFNKTSGFRTPDFGQSNIPRNVVVDNPGVYEDANLAYLPEVLFRKKGIPAALAILFSDVLRRLVLRGSINFIAKIDCSDLSTVPRAEVVHGLLSSSFGSEERKLGNTNGDSIDSKDHDRHIHRRQMAALNMVSSDALGECLTHLKRSYWPFAWDGRRGGFFSAAKTWLTGAESAELEAIARTAAHRLERGIWTSPGAGDLRRCISASERLVILRGEDRPVERRDLAVLYCHAGMFREALAELRAYKRAVARSGSAPSKISELASNSSRQRFVITQGTGVSVSDGEEHWEDAVYADKLLQAISSISEAVTEANTAVVPLTLETAMARCQELSSTKVLPLTW